MTDHYASGRAAGIREAAEAVRNEALAEPTDNDSDAAYNTAISHAHDAALALLGQDPEPGGVKGPDWESFGRDMLAEWPARDVDGSELFEAALRHNLIREIPGGYDPDRHIDAEGIGPEKGDQWYEYSYGIIRTTPAPVTPQEAARVLLGAAQNGSLPFYPIEMPLSKDGQGPATVGVDAATMTYEVWHSVTLNAVSSDDNLSKALSAWLRAIAETEEGEG